MKLKFGTKGVWHMPSSENHGARKMRAVVLEQITDGGLLYIFTDKPIIKGSKNLSGRTATIFSKDFTPDVLVSSK